MLLLSEVKKSFLQPTGERLPILDVERFVAAAGEQLALIGESGCGKTTLLHIIAGITAADSGVVQVDGVNLASLPEAGRDRFRAERIGYVFQTFNLLPGFSALENVLLGMSFAGRGAEESRARTLLDRVGLSSRLSHPPGRMSVGEQQRVAVARALANRPKLLLADEPTANVDARHQQEIVDLIRESCSEDQVTLVMVTHAAAVAEQFDRVEKLAELNRVLAVAAAS